MTDELAIIDRAVEQYKPSHVFGLFSGGHDSLCACHIAAQHPSFSAAVHINTGIGIEETRQFVRDTCIENGWTLKEYYPPVSYEELCIRWGVPGPGGHALMYQRLKERCLQQLLRETRDKNDRRRKVIFISGRRRHESKRRMRTTTSSIITGLPNPSPRVVWVAPIIEWQAEEKHSYMAEHNLRSNLVSETLCMSGECLCGAFAKRNELNQIRQFYPAAAAEIDRISALVKDAGQHHVWGTAPGKRIHPDQAELPLCWSCQAQAET